VQEALTNVAKHARATHVDIVLEHTDSAFVMSVIDNGVGFDAATATAAGRRQSLGMVTMRERTQAVGGGFEIQAAADGGTRVIVSIPS
jgi:two-component system sensor histidine kinase NreB